MILSKIFPQTGKTHWVIIVKRAFIILFMGWYNMRHFPGIWENSTINTVFKNDT